MAQAGGLKRSNEKPSLWRSLRAAAGPPQTGAHIQTVEAGITVDVMQDCRIALPSGNRIPAVGVTVASNRPGVAAQVSIAANLNRTAVIRVDGRGPGPVHRDRIICPGSLVVLPSGWPVLGLALKRSERTVRQTVLR
jgi:hypothetical protein